MGRITAILDEEVNYGFEGGPEYKTNVIDLENRFEERDSAWKYPKHKYSANLGNLNDVARERVIKIFHACRGRRHSFMFLDYNDYQAIDEVVNTFIGTLNPIQLYKTYTFGNAYTIRPITALNGSECVVKTIAGVTIAGTFDVLTGQFTPTDPWPAATAKWSGEFYVWVRFEDDYTSMTIANWSQNTADISLVEDVVPFTPTNVPDSWEE